MSDDEIESITPYKAEPVGPYGWWIVTDKNGQNVGIFNNYSGRTTGSKEEAHTLADKLNKEAP